MEPASMLQARETLASITAAWQRGEISQAEAQARMRAFLASLAAPAGAGGLARCLERAREANAAVFMPASWPESWSHPLPLSRLTPSSAPARPIASA